MQHVEVQFNTRTYGVKSSLEELRRRYRQSPGFARLLRAAAYAQLRRGEQVTLSASNPGALRALLLAVCGVRRTMELDTLGAPIRDVYLMQDKKGWREASPERAAAELKRISLDAITVMKVTVFDPALSWRDAAALDARHAPETVYIADETLPFSEPRDRTSAHPNMFEEDASTYNDAGELETPAERRERLATRGPHRETFEDAWRPLPLRSAAYPAPIFCRAPHAAWYEPSRVVGYQTARQTDTKNLPAAPWYYAAEYKMAAEDQATLSAERRAFQQRRALLDDDENERLEFYDLDAELSPDDLEEGMLEPWEALENFAAVR